MVFVEGPVLPHGFPVCDGVVNDPEDGCGIVGAENFSVEMEFLRRGDGGDYEGCAAAAFVKYLERRSRYYLPDTQRSEDGRRFHD